MPQRTAGWTLGVQQIAGALRASVNRSTGFTANRLMLGREVNPPASLMFPRKGERLEEDNYAHQLVKDLQTAHECARNKLKAATKRMKRNYDLRLLERNFEVGDAVYVLDTATLKGKCKKLCPPWKGPGLVVRKLSNLLFQIKLKNAVLILNHDRLKPCQDKTLPAWLTTERDRPELDGGEIADDQLYCLCKKPWQGRFMIQCDHCDEWYHGSCVNITATDALDIQKYRCPKC